jgi:MoaA/NifB/PqqE/SkfB family radical SAM enzyme
MIKTTAIKLVKPEPMMVTWDTGRRCNYDCSYCESTRHDTNSPYHSLDELKQTFDFVKSWTEKYNKQRQVQSHTNINFTGGEPTMNPAFWDLVDYVKAEPGFELSLTTNGAWNSKYTQKIIDRFHGVTVSYHAEGHPELKKQVLANIMALKKSGIRLQVNVMLHVDHWAESMDVYKSLKRHNINVKPRPIGDGGVDRPGWFVDADGTNRRTTHDYDRFQQGWFFEEMGIKGTVEEVKQGTQLGRGCCGGRCLQGKVNDSWREVTLVNNEFKDWSCMVDWYFLHIDQHTGDVYHHQTCQAKHDGSRGTIGNLKDIQPMLDALNQHLANPTPIVCPNMRCGCGMCIPKAESKEDFDRLWTSIVRTQETQN